MAKGNPLFFNVRAPIGGWYGLFRDCGYGRFEAFVLAHGSPRTHAVGVARAMMADKWKGAEVDGTICAISMPDGRVWRIASADGSRVTQIVRGTPEHEKIAGFLGAAAGFGV